MQRLYNGLSILLASLCLVFFIILSAQAQQAETTSLEVSKPGQPFAEAPSFEYLDDVFETRSPDYSEHKLTAVHFWATWCLPCVDEMPQVDAAQELFRGGGLFAPDDFRVIPIAIDGRNMNKVKRFYYNKKIEHLDAFLDPTQETPKKAGLRGLPGTIFVNSAGQIIALADGPLDWESEQVQRFLKSHLTKD